VLPDELLSSWLSRLARANALKLQELLTMVTRTRRSYMGRDLDGLIDPEFATSLAALSGIPPTKLVGWTYGANSLDLTAADQLKKGGRRWILPKVSKSRRPTAPWLQFCLPCLQSDATPYMRRRWRYAFLTTCEIHGGKLSTHCPFCGAPFDFEGYDIDAPLAERVAPISACTQCRRDIRQACVSFEAADVRVVRYERALCAAADRGWTRVRGVGWVYSHQVFDVLHRLLRLLHAKNGLRRLLIGSAFPGAMFGTPFDVPLGRFEGWPYDVRHQVMAWLSGLLRGWPEHFVEQCSQFNVLRSSIHGHRGSVPYWFDQVLHDRLYRPWYKPSPEEILSVRSAIVRAGQPDTQYNLRRWLGLYCPDEPCVRRLALPSPEQLSLFGEAPAADTHKRNTDDDPSREQFEVIRSKLARIQRRVKSNTPDLYDVWCAVLYRLRTGCPWAALPSDFPKWATVYWYYVRWKARRPDGASLLEESLRISRSDGAIEVDRQ